MIGFDVAPVAFETVARRLVVAFGQLALAPLLARVVCRRDPGESTYHARQVFSLQVNGIFFPIFRQKYSSRG